ncbi:MAG: IS30 family transposase [Alphaproteobacteria bacterium]|nr:IS30 family transposase [Alphaproteobacteria bacterium]
MGRTYKQLSEEERVRIYHWHANGKSARWMGEALGRSASTICRELRRNCLHTKTWHGGYEPLRAHRLALRRRHWDARFKLVRQPLLRKLVYDGLAMGWSPEQIAGRLTRLLGTTVISYEAIYRFIYYRVDQKDYWNRLLPRRKFRRGWYRRKALNPVEHIKDRRPIALRDPAALSRQTPGHWETDLMLFSNHKANVLVTQERAPRFVLLAFQPDKKSERVYSNLSLQLGSLPQALRQTLSQDNSTEFAKHYCLNEKLGILTFFCDPRSPWQKGGVENVNGRLRRWLPLSTKIADVDQDRVNEVASRLNSTPRKCLGFKTPAEVFFDHLLHFKCESTSPPARG